MTTPQRTAELLEKHLAPIKDSNPAWEVGTSKIDGRGIMATRDIKRGEIIFHDRPILIGPAARDEDILNTCTICFKLLPDTKFMCRNNCGLPVCQLCAKKEQHQLDCALFKSWEPIETDVANSMIVRLLCVARAINLTQEERDLIFCLYGKLDNNHRSEVRNAARCFKKFPTDKKLIDIMNRTVAMLRINGFDETPERVHDNQEFFYRALYPLYALVNHDCVPNAYYTFDEKTHHMAMIASVDIPAGTEVTTTHTKLFTGNIARYAYLKSKKLFICKCQRCSDPTEKGSFISAVYCRDTNCSGLAVPETTGLPQPNWNCLECKQKSSHAQMSKAQDLASGALHAKSNSKSLKNLIQYLNEKCSSFIPESNYVVIDAKLQVIARLAKSMEDCGDESIGTRAKYCQDIMNIMDKLGLGDCVMRTYLEKEKAK